MSKKLYLPLFLLLIFSMVLGACAPQAAPEVEVATEVVVTEAATEAPTEAPTAEPTAEPTDFVAVFTDVFGSLSKENGYAAISVTDLNNLLVENPPFLLDIREPAEVAEGYIEGAVNIPLRDLLDNLDKLPGLDDPIVVYCGSGHRGTIALSALTALGYTDVKNMGGGTGAWKKAELALTTEPIADPESISTPIVEDEQLFTSLNEFFKAIPEGFYATNAAGLNEKIINGEDLLIVDTRRPDEVEKNGYIEGTVFLPYETMLDNLDQLPEKDAPIVIYCGSGHRSGIAMTALRMIGYTNVISMGGGFGAWKAAELPVAGVVDWQAEWGTFLASLADNMRSIGAADLNTALVENPPFLLDVREAGELEANGYIEGAVHIPTREVLNNLDKLPAMDEPIVVYCASGHRGALVAAALIQLGYEDVKNLGGGMGAWLKSELPAVTGSMPESPAAGTAPEVDPIKFEALSAYLANLPDGFSTISAADLNTALVESELFLLDVRTAEELAADGVIEGSVNIPIVELFTRLSELPEDKDTPMVVFCKSGHRGGFALIALNMIGYTDVKNLGGGTNAWIAAELPVVK